MNAFENPEKEKNDLKFRKIKCSNLRWVYGLFLMLMFLWMGNFDACARPTTTQEAKNVVSAWLAEDPTPMGAQMSLTIRDCQAFKDKEGKSLYYVVYLISKGIVLVSGDDWVEPIVGFVPEAIDYNPGDDDPLGALVNRDIPERVRYVRNLQSLSAAAKTNEKVKNSKSNSHRARWSRLLIASRVASSSSEDFSSEPLVGVEAAPDLSDVRVPFLIQSTWGQTTANGQKCYNYYTPEEAMCGCVATAMAQVMRYYEWPKMGIGIRAFMVNLGMEWVDGVPVPRETLSLVTIGGDESGGPYKWELMAHDPRAITDPDSFAAVCRTIGALCYDVGVSVGMWYKMNEKGESGAAMSATAGALKNVFYYDNAVVCSPNTSTWDRILNSNLDAACPCMMAIQDGDGGHAIVCDGYGYQAMSLYHHLNLGWNGSKNAWYNLPTLGNGDGLSFTKIGTCVYNIFPEGTGQIISGRILDRWGEPMEDVTVKATIGAGVTYSAVTNSRGIYAIKHIPANITFSLNASKSGYTFTSRQVATGTNNAETTGNLWGGVCDFIEGLEYPHDPVRLTLSVLPNESFGTLTATAPAATYRYYQRGSKVSLMATVMAEYQVKSWSGADDDRSTAQNNTVTMTDDKTVIVEFEKINDLIPTGTYTLTTQVVGGNGEISPGDVNSYEAGTQVVVSCNPDPGYRILRWTGTDDDSTSAASNIVTMTGDKTVMVEFEAIPVYSLSVNVVGGSGILEALLPTYPENTIVTVTCNPDAGYQIKQWMGTLDDSSKSTSNTVKMTGDKVVSVELEKIVVPPDDPPGKDGGDIPGDPNAPSGGFCTVPAITMMTLMLSCTAFLAEKRSPRSKGRKV